MGTEDCPEDVRVLLSLLTQGNPAERKQAAQSLGACGERARVAVPTLVKALLTDPASPVRVSAGWALCSIHVGDEDGPALLVGLKDRDSGIRFWSARALATARPSPLYALPALLEALREETVLPARDFIRWALKAIGPTSVAPLAEWLHSEQLQLRLRAVGALAGGSLARAGLSIEPLLGALGDPDAQVRQLAAQAFGVIGREHPGQILTLSATSSDAVHALGRCLSDEDTRVRERAAWVLMWLGDDARPVVDQLRMALLDPDDRTRLWAGRAIEHLASDVPE
jgi:HEAT repeat protein